MCQYGYEEYNPSFKVTNEEDDFDKVASKYIKENPNLTKKQARQKAIDNMTATLGDDDW